MAAPPHLDRAPGTLTVLAGSFARLQKKLPTAGRSTLFCAGCPLIINNLARA